MKTILSLIVLSFAFALAGCNTVAGAGRDIQRAGDAIEDAAKRK